MNSYAERDGSGSPALATVSLVLGIISLALFITGVSVFIGALAVILALLSRGSGPMRSHAVTGLITGITGIAVTISMISLSLLLLSPEDLDLYREQIQEIYEEYGGTSSESPLASGSDSPALVCSQESSGWIFCCTEQEYTL